MVLFLHFCVEQSPNHYFVQEMINIHLNVKSTYFGNTGKRRVGAPDVTKPAAVIMRPENQV